MPVKMALLANFLSALSCFLGLVIGIEVGQQGEVRLWFFAIAGGIFLYVALVDMVRSLLVPQLLIYTLGGQVIVEKYFKLGGYSSQNICQDYPLFLHYTTLTLKKLVHTVSDQRDL